MYNVKNVRMDFKSIHNINYLDNASTSQKPMTVIRSMLEYLKTSANPGRGIYNIALSIENKYESIREKVGSFFNVSKENIIFTKSTTEGINIISNGLNLKCNDNIIITSIEHNSNLIPWIQLMSKGITITIVNANENGFVSIHEIIQRITPNTKVVSISHISNFYGSEQNIKLLVKQCHEFGITVLIDGAQSAGHIDINLKDIDCDLFVTSGHKGLLGPQGIGILYIKNPSILKPLIYGGGMVSSLLYPKVELKKFPYCFEAGTQNIPGIIGLGAGINYINKIGIISIEKHEKHLINYLYSRLKNMNNIFIYGSSTRSGLLSFNIEGIDPHSVAMYLNSNNICVRSGYHCSNYIHNKLKIDGSVRISVGLYNTIEGLKEAIDCIYDLISKI